MLEPPLGAKATYTFTISLDQPLPNDVYANYSTVNGTGPTGAKAGRDFLGVTNVTVKIPAGSTSVPVSVTVLGDAPEPVGGPTDAFFTVVLNWSVDSKNGNQVVNTSSATADIKEPCAHDHDAHHPGGAHVGRHVWGTGQPGQQLSDGCVRIGSR